MAAAPASPAKGDAGDKPSKRGASREHATAERAAGTPVTPARPRPAASPAAEPQQFGQLTVGAEPYAYVRIDDTEIGATPLIDYRLTVGPHRVELLDPRNRGVLLSRDIWIEVDERESITLP